MHSGASGWNPAIRHVSQRLVCGRVKFALIGLQCFATEQARLYRQRAITSPPAVISAPPV